MMILAIRVQIAEAEYEHLVSGNYKPFLSLANIRDAVHIYVNGELAGPVLFILLNTSC